MKKIQYVFVIIVSILISSCTSNYCPKEETIEAAGRLIEITTEWNDVLDQAKAAMLLGDSIRENIVDLDSLQNDVDLIDLPPCLNDSIYLLNNFMDYQIEGFILYKDSGLMAYDQITDKFEMANEYQNKWNEKLDELMECLPNCEAR